MLNTEDLDKPIASSAVPSTKLNKDGKKNSRGGTGKDDSIEMSLWELWAELVQEKEEKKRSKSSKISVKDL